MSEMLGDLIHFHFIRPWWLLALFLLPLIWLGFKRYRQMSSSWAKAVDLRLLGYLLEQTNSVGQQTAKYVITFAALIAMLALAGPAWKKIPAPVHKAEDALVILMDLSLSMQAEDIKPSRLIKARHKLIDLLDARQQGQTALVAFAGDAHIVSPLTDDTETIKAMVPALSPLIMPAMGSRADLAMEMALEMLENSLISEGQILLITDGLTHRDSGEIQTLLKGSKHSLAVLSVGTVEGAPIPIPEQGFLKQRGDIVIAGNDPAPLADLANALSARVISLQLDDTDIDYLLDRSLLTRAEQTREVEREFDQWYEEGPWLLLILIPIAAIAFRKGYLFTLFLLVLVHPEPGYALSWQDLWKTGDQQGADAFAEGDYQGAAELFDSTDWRASALYKAGSYESAAQAFAEIKTAAGYYNRGNALARSGNLKEALTAYRNALDLDPSHEDARFNRDLVEQLLAQQEKNQQQDSQSGTQGDDSQQQEPNGDQQQKAEQNQQQKSSSDSKEQPSDDNSQSGTEQSQQQNDASPAPSEQTAQEQTAPQAQQDQQQEELANPLEQSSEQDPTSDQEHPGLASPEMQEQSEQQQAYEQWLRRVPDDPSGLLKRKFDYQYRQRQLDNQFLPPEEDQPIW